MNYTMETSKPRNEGMLYCTSLFLTERRTLNESVKHILKLWYQIFNISLVLQLPWHLNSRMLNLQLLLKNYATVIIRGEMMERENRKGRRGGKEGNPYTYKNVSCEIIITIKQTTRKKETCTDLSLLELCCIF